MTHDRVQQDYMALTHKFLSMMLGMRRAAAITASALKQAVLIDFTRDTLTVKNGKGLEEVFLRMRCRALQAVLQSLSERLASCHCNGMSGGIREIQAAEAAVVAEDMPAAFAEDGPCREAIVRTAIQRAKEQHSGRHFERIVSVGDAIWDVHTARQLEVPFVGVAAGKLRTSCITRTA